MSRSGWPERCPVCRRPATAEHAPFCSRICRDRDLLAWLEGRYRLPGPPAPPSTPDEPDR
ncbi:MAG: DNA gyrase inhibitor YacG [Sphingomonadaceae bacterium]|uniref:DNA gyrase inhibitor YacG n=1 Tax=Thermaurantiacus sp. TaxID=2820283 RepID=UPI00298ED1D8|nr:DNA gyrase inhibitor YacG [Thermaurantiacus sp.]MCS6986274.1 DNA gyrase inhibitor YacG [Sphingomonadaceae bacterium]MDW8415723.1 DNA gyrase inhibitor YacG [Thermaurantiacus sp.]